ncbi:hypothetical protein EI555_016672, partial [Monodon monoceros]
GLGPGSRDTAHSSGRKRPAQPRGNAPEGEWAGTRARLKDGRRRPAATAPEGLRLPPVPADHRRLLTMKPVSRRTLDRIYSALLLAVVLLSWGYVIYASTVAARRQLRKKYPKSSG